MRLRVKFTEEESRFDVSFSEQKNSFAVDFGELVLVERTDIPKEYGLITYTQDKILTVS